MNRIGLFFRKNQLPQPSSSLDNHSEDSDESVINEESIEENNTDNETERSPELSDIPVTPNISPGNSEVNSSVEKEPESQNENTSSPEAINSISDSLPKTPTGTDHAFNDLIAAVAPEIQSQIAGNSNSIPSDIQTTSDSIQNNSMRLKSKSKTNLKRKNYVNKTSQPTKIITRNVENNYRKSLTNENRIIYDKVMHLSELTLESLRKDKTNHVLRPCISIVEKEIITLDKWKFYEKFTEYYIRRFLQEGKAFKCKFTKKDLPKFSKMKKFEVVKIFGDLNNNEFLLIQYAANFTDPSKAFENYHKGEISWVHESIIGTENAVYKKYLNGISDFKGAFDRNTFTSRPIKMSKIINENNNLSQFQESHSFKIMDNLRKTRYPDIEMYLFENFN